MTQNKDKLEKVLLDYNDVFADIINVLVFGGEKVIREEELLPSSTESIYKQETGDYASQFRDVSKIY